MWIEIFKSGSQTDSAGRTKEWTQGDLDKIVEKYNNQPVEQRHEAPVVLGHPAVDDPAFGWVETLQREGSILKAKLRDLAPEFVEWVKNGLYKKRSISLYNDLLLKHVGFLGGTPPAVKGLADPQFDSSKESFCFEFSSEEIQNPSNADQQRTDQPEDNHQMVRSSKFGIEVKAIGNKVKPQHYGELSDDDFADPVHYRFPLTKNHIKATLASWSRESVQKQYSVSEIPKIAARIITAAKAFNINLTPFKWAYSDAGQSEAVNYNDLSKNQLIDVIEQLINPQTFEEAFMDESTFAQFSTELANWAGSTFNEEIGSQIAAKAEELRKKFFTQSKDQPNAKDKTKDKPADQPKFSDLTTGDTRVSELEAKVARLETEKRLMDYNSKLNELISAGKLTPAQRNFALSALEMGYKSGSIEFAEDSGIVQKSGVEVITKLLNSYPKQLEFGDAGHGESGKNKDNTGFESFNTDPSALELHAKAIDYAKTNKVSYMEAIKEINKLGGN